MSQVHLVFVFVRVLMISSGGGDTGAPPPRRVRTLALDTCAFPARVVLGRRAGGTWGLPGGALEAGEDAVAGALRELHEEAGIGRDLVARVTLLRGVQPPSGVALPLPDMYVAELAPGAAAAAPLDASRDPDEEFDELAWFDLAAAAALVEIFPDAAAAVRALAAEHNGGGGGGGGGGTRTPQAGVGAGRG